jgi:hypothetical protein
MPISTAGVISLELYHADGTFYASATTPYTHSSAQSMWMRTQREGQSLRAKVWPVGTSGSAPWRWLASCRDCGEPHERRELRCRCGTGARSISWAAEDDHSYRLRLDTHSVGKLHAEYLKQSEPAAGKAHMMLTKRPLPDVRPVVTHHQDRAHIT